jgi:uncharacterized membrane protein YidH (DUF202 family)
MPQRFIRNLSALETEEQILNGSALLALAGVFLPWMSGEWLGGDTVTYSGFGFYTSFIGLTICLLQAVLILMTLSPLVGGPVLVKKRLREPVRLSLAVLSTVLVLAALTVLMKVTFEFSRMEVRFGVYVTLIGCLITLLYAFLRFQEHRKSLVQELFHHPEDKKVPEEKKESFVAAPPPPPPPPPPPAPEEHRLYP